MAPASSFAIRSSLSIVVRPSEQIRKTSPGAAGTGLHVGLHLGLGAERSGDDRALRVVLGLRLGDLPLAPHLLDQRVVAGQLLEPAAAQAVGAAVADVADRHLFALGVDDRRGQRRAHPGPRGIGAGELVDLAVGGEDRLAQDPLGRPVGEVDVEGLGGRLRGHLAGLRAAHAVGDDEDRRADEEGVLVGAALAAGVGAESLVVDPQHQPPPGLEPELGVADPHHVAVDQLRLSLQGRVVEQGAVGRAHVLDVGAAVTTEDPCVHAGGITVVDPHVGFGGAADREAADQVEALARLEPAAALGDQPGLSGAARAVEGRATGWKPVASGAGATVRRRSFSALRAIQSRKR